VVLQAYMIFIGMTHIWTKEKIGFLVENYPTKGGRFCADELNLSIKQIGSKVQKLNLVKDRPIDLNDFVRVVKPEISYVLGLLWADGHVKIPYEINLECVSDDMVFFEPIFNSIGKWCKYERERGHRPQTKLYLSDKNLVKFLLDNDYGNKSHKSPTKIIDKIPKELRHYFFRGFLDGDGCFYHNPKQYAREVSFSGSYEQDWSDMLNLCEELEIKKHKVYRRKNKHGSQSSFRITNKDGITKMGEYIYSGKQFGLHRKLEKFNNMKKT
jgi:hypothetical protein